MTVPQFPSHFVVLASPAKGVSARLDCGCGRTTETIMLDQEPERFTCACGMLYTIRVAGNAVELEAKHIVPLPEGATISQQRDTETEQIEKAYRRLGSISVAYGSGNHSLKSEAMELLSDVLKHRRESVSVKQEGTDG